MVAEWQAIKPPITNLLVHRQQADTNFAFVNAHQGASFLSRVMIFPLSLDPAMHATLREHPGLMGKALNVRKHRGLDGVAGSDDLI